MYATIALGAREGCREFVRFFRINYLPQVSESSILYDFSFKIDRETVMARVFERFFRTNEGRTREATGSGLGLSISKHIIEAHGQNIHVRSKENVGTSIGFTLNTRRES